VTTLATHPVVSHKTAAVDDRAAVLDDARELVRIAHREALEAFVERYHFVDRGERFVGTPENRVPAGLAVEMTLRALWKNGGGK
jgi:hypothetical protein